MNVSGAMFTYLLNGERELTLNRFNTLIDALDIKRGTKVHKEFMDVRRLMPQPFNIHIPTTTSELVRESLNELITKNRLEFTITRK